MNIWRIESNPRKQTLLTWAIVLVGLILVYGFRNYAAAHFGNSMAGFLLGIFLLAIGIPALFLIGKQTITVDRTEAHITIEDVTFQEKKENHSL